jgi:hypothetical protein
MSEAAGWDALPRSEQRALIELFGGGSFRRCRAPARSSAGDEHDTLSERGLFVLTLAIRRQQGVVARRSMITK